MPSDSAICSPVMGACFFTSSTIVSCLEVSSILVASFGREPLSQSVKLAASRLRHFLPIFKESFDSDIRKRMFP